MEKINTDCKRWNWKIWANRHEKNFKSIYPAVSSCVKLSPVKGRMRFQRFKNYSKLLRGNTVRWHSTSSYSQNNDMMFLTKLASRHTKLKIQYRFEINYCNHLSMPSRKSEIKTHPPKEANIFNFSVPSLGSVRYSVFQLPVEVFYTKIIHSGQ